MTEMMRMNFAFYLRILDMQNSIENACIGV